MGQHLFDLLPLASYKVPAEQYKYFSILFRYRYVVVLELTKQRSVFRSKE